MGALFLWLGFGGLTRPLLHHQSLGPAGALRRGQRHEVRPRGQVCGVEEDPLHATVQRAVVQKRDLLAEGVVQGDLTICRLGKVQLEAGDGAGRVGVQSLPRRGGVHVVEAAGFSQHAEGPPSLGAGMGRAPDLPLLASADT